MKNLEFILIISALNVVCFLVGAILGQKLKKGEDIKIPNPITKTSEIIEDIGLKREMKKEQERNDIVLQNIDNYDGTSMGQIDIPR